MEFLNSTNVNAQSLLGLVGGLYLSAKAIKTFRLLFRVCRNYLVKTYPDFTKYGKWAGK